MTDHKQAISLEEARTIMRSLVLAKGEDYVYEKPALGCLYFEDGKPSCLVGHVFAVLGVTEVDEGPTATRIVPEVFPATPDYVVYALRRAQGIQDDGGTWGEALAAFEETIESEVAA